MKWTPPRLEGLLQSTERYVDTTRDRYGIASVEGGHMLTLIEAITELQLELAWLDAHDEQTFRAMAHAEMVRADREPLDQLQANRRREKSAIPMLTAPWVLCRKCLGDGSFNRGPCPECGGAGGFAA